MTRSSDFGLGIEQITSRFDSTLKWGATEAPTTYCDPPDSPEPWNDHWGGVSKPTWVSGRSGSMKFGDIQRVVKKINDQ